MRSACALVLATVITTCAACGGSSPPGGQSGSTAASPPPANGGGAPAAPAESPPSSPADASPPSADHSSTATTAAGPNAVEAAPKSAMAAPGVMSVTTNAVEVKVESVATVSQIGPRKARNSYTFVIVDTSWKNVIPLKAIDKNAGGGSSVGGLSGFGSNKPKPDPKNVTMEPTPYVVPMLQKQIWLFTDDRFADTVDLEAQAATPDALSENGFVVEKLNDVVRGKVVFEAPAGSRYRVFQFYDNDHGHAAIAVSGAKPPPAPTVGPTRTNGVLQVSLSEAAFSQARPAPAGQRLFVVGLRGISRSAADIVNLEINKYVFAQTDQGCVSPPATDVDALTRPFGELASFPPTSPNEGQIAFRVPDDSRSVRVLITPGQSGTITLPAGPDFKPAWPAPQTTIQDGATMRVHILPSPPRPSSLPAPGAGREHVIVDVVLENLKSSQGIEFQPDEQLRLMDPAGGFIQASPISKAVACYLDESGIIPAGNARRFMLVYDVPAGMPRKLQYRGFEKDDVVVEIRR